MREATFKEITSIDNYIDITNTNTDKSLLDQYKENIISLFNSMDKGEILELTKRILEEEESKSE